MSKHVAPDDLTLVRRPAKARRAAEAIVADSKRGPAMCTNVEQHCAGLGRAQLAEVVQFMFAELATLYRSPIER
jgi:hypothetical protein